MDSLLEKEGINPFEYCGFAKSLAVICRPDGKPNLYFEGRCPANHRNIVYLCNLASEVSGLKFENPEMSKTDAYKGFFLYHFPESENIARIIITFY